MIHTKRVYEPPAPEDGFRLLVTRLWPHRVFMDEVDAWEPDLGPSRDILQAFRKGHIDWDTLTRHYLEEMAEQQPLLKRYQKLGRSQTVTLLCSCEDKFRCHRTSLRGLLEQV